MKRIHSSWLIAAASLGILLGVSLALLWPYFTALPWLLTAVMLLLMIFIKRIRLMIPVLLLGGIFLGLFVGSLKYEKLYEYRSFYGISSTIGGRVVDDTTLGRDKSVQLRLGDVTINGRKMDSNIWVGVNTKTDIKRGDQIVVKGVLDKGFGNIPASVFRAELFSAHRPEPGDVARKARDNFSEKIRRYISEPEASLGISYLVGAKKALPEDLEDKFRILGLVHVVVASGFHLMVLVRFVREPFLRVSRFFALSATFAAVLGFLLLTGFSATMVRASFVAGLGLLAWYFGRNFHPVFLLLFVAAVTVLIDPSYLWGDLGWYLSFAAFFGVIVLAPLIHVYLWGDKPPGAIRYLLVGTTAAQIATFPIVVFVFGEYSPLALLSNLLVLPFVSLAMLGVFLTGILGYVSGFLAGVVAFPTEIILKYTVGVVDWMSQLSFSSKPVTISVIGLTIYYVVVLVVTIFMVKKTKYTFRDDFLFDKMQR